MHFTIRSKVVLEQLQNLIVGSTFMRVNVEEIRGLLVPMPPPTEQCKIAEFINNESTKIDKLLAEANRAIDLFQERRSALISAAVTGQIDVRNYHPQEAAAVCQ